MGRCLQNGARQMRFSSLTRCEFLRQLHQVFSVGTAAVEFSAQPSKALGRSGLVLSRSNTVQPGPKCAALYQHTRLSCRLLNGNRLSGSIPASWNVTGSFAALKALALDGNPSLCDAAVPALLQPAVCDSQATSCADGQISCQPVGQP